MQFLLACRAPNVFVCFLAGLDTWVNDGEWLNHNFSSLPSLNSFVCWLHASGYQRTTKVRRWQSPKMYHSFDAMPLGSSTAIDSCINCMLYRDILMFHRLMIAGMRGSGVGRSVRECLSLPADRFLVGPPPTQCFPLVSWQDWTWQALWMPLFCEKLPLYKCLLSLVYLLPKGDCSSGVCRICLLDAERSSFGFGEKVL